MRHNVFLTDSAVSDIMDIWRHIATCDSEAAADKVKDSIKKSVGELSLMPLRGHFPPELERIGVFDYREIHCKPWRIIYLPKESDVYVIAALDGRRDIRDILSRRLLKFNA